MPMDPARALLLFILFQATEKTIHQAGGRVSPSLLQSTLRALEAKSQWLDGPGETLQRWEAFLAAFHSARRTALAASPDRDATRILLRALPQFDAVDPLVRRWLDDPGLDLARTCLLQQLPDMETISRLCGIALGFQGITLTKKKLPQAVAAFIPLFQQSLLAQPPYRSILTSSAWTKFPGSRLRYPG